MTELFFVGCACPGKVLDFTAHTEGTCLVICAETLEEGAELSLVPGGGESREATVNIG